MRETKAAPIPSIVRARRYRQRRKAGIRYVRIRFSQPALAALVAGGFLCRDKQEEADIERAFYALLNAARFAEVTARDA